MECPATSWRDPYLAGGRDFRTNAAAFPSGSAGAAYIETQNNRAFRKCPVSRDTARAVQGWRGAMGHRGPRPSPSCRRSGVSLHSQFHLMAQDGCVYSRHLMHIWPGRRRQRRAEVLPHSESAPFEDRPLKAPGTSAHSSLARTASHTILGGTAAF